MTDREKVMAVWPDAFEIDGWIFKSSLHAEHHYRCLLTGNKSCEYPPLGFTYTEAAQHPSVVSYWEGKEDGL